jgi:hypothetical protein
MSRMGMNAIWNRYPSWTMIRHQSTAVTLRDVMSYNFMEHSHPLLPR